MRHLVIISFILISYSNTYGLTISEVMSNPVGDDGGREWIEVYNEGAEAVSVSQVSVSIKGGSAISFVSLQGGTVIAPGEYAILSSIVSTSNPTSRFLDSTLGYPSYSGVLLRAVSSMTLVNSGQTSIDLKLSGVIVDSLSYTPANEGKTLSKVSGSFISGTPTPGAQNQGDQTPVENTEAVTTNQGTIPQMAPPSPDIIIYVPESRIVVAGAEAVFSVHALTKAGNTIANLKANWGFGDGGQAQGSSTLYTYTYPGTYLARVEAGDSSILGVATTKVTVVKPELTIAAVGFGKYGTYVDIENPNAYELDISQWRLHIGESIHVFPKHTVLPKQATIRMSGKALGFASTTPREGALLKITFPSQEEITRFEYKEKVTQVSTSSITKIALTQNKQQSNVLRKVETKEVKSSTSSTTKGNLQKRDTRIVDWMRSIFSQKP